MADRPVDGRADYRPGGTYGVRELGTLVERAAELGGRPTRELLRRFGESLFGRFASLYPICFHEAESAVGFVA